VVNDLLTLPRRTSGVAADPVGLDEKNLLRLIKSAGRLDHGTAQIRVGDLGDLGILLRLNYMRVDMLEIRTDRVFR
jgi:hypothetical protein